MNLRIEIAAEAQKEFDEAFDWYTRVDPALAQEFLTEIDSILVHVLETPDAFPLVPEGPREVRWVRIHRFPYRIVYRRKGDVIRIHGFAHAKRRPLFWRHRVRE